MAPRPGRIIDKDISFQTARFYDVEANEQKSKFDHRAAVLDCCFSDGGHAYTGGLDQSVRECVPMILSSSLSSIADYIMCRLCVGSICKQSNYGIWANTRAPFLD